MSPTEELSAKGAPVNEYMRAEMPELEEGFGVRRLKASRTAPSVFRLEPGESDLLHDLAVKLLPGPGESPEEFCEEAALLAAYLPLRLRKQLRRFSLNGSAEGYLVLRNLATDEEPPQTPLDSSHHLGERSLAAATQAIVGQGVGELVGFEGDAEGRIFQDVVPTRDAGAGVVLDVGVESGPRTDRAHSSLRPDWLSLGCLRGRYEEAIYFLSARTLLKALDPEEQGLAREPLWTTRPRDPAAGAEPCRDPVPIIEGSADDPFVRFDGSLDWGITPTAESLRLKINEIWPELRTSYTLIPGELLLIDNRRVVFGHSSFEARFDGSDRFIVRSYLVSDLAKSRHARFGNSRTIGARFG